MEKIYFNINKIFDSYINEGVKIDNLLYYLNVNEDNFKYMYNRIYRKLTLEKIQFTSEQLTEAIIDIVQDKIYLMNDLNNK